MSDVDLFIARAESFGVDRCYAIGKAPAGAVYPYAVMSIDTGRTLNRRAGGPGRKVRRLIVEMFDRDIDGVLALADKFDAAFDDTIITELPERPSSRRQLAADPYRDPDTGGVLKALHIYAYE